jgi:Cdc6-like AAA superfamily ATPase
MGRDPEQDQWLASLARQLSEGLRSVEMEMERALHSTGRHPVGDALVVSSNPMLGPSRAEHHLVNNRQNVLQDLIRLRDEPFVAYVVAEDESGTKKQLYFARSSPPSSAVPGLEGGLANYRCPLGRLAEHTPGDTVDLPLPDGRQTHVKTFTVLERVLLRPVRHPQGWDGRDDRISAADIIVTLDSLRDFLAQLEAAKAAPSDLLGALLAEVRAAAAVREGVRRHVIDRMSLRDQPVLDRYQGEIFRLPLNTRLMVTGPAGTGKTTTLIRRLAQKRNIDEIAEEERQLIPPDHIPRFFHPNNWTMFTPTELLKQYLKEAFAKEGVAASDERVRTWSDQRRRLGREVLQVLRSERGGRLTLDDEAGYLLDLTSGSLIELADAFVSFVQRQVVERYEEAFKVLAGTNDVALAEVVGRIRRRAGETRMLFDQLFGLPALDEDLREQVQRIAEAVNQTVRSILNAQLGKRHDLLDQIADYLNTVTLDPEQEDDDDTGSEEEESATLRDPRVLAMEAFRRAIYVRARSLHDGRPINRKSRSAGLLEWLGDDIPGETTLRPLGATLATLRHARFLSTTYRNLINSVPSLYQRFRRAALREGAWYQLTARTAIERGRIGGAELDVILLVMLRHVRRILTQGGGRLLAEDSRFGALEGVKAEYVTQILVDEATDFSPVQLACMLELANPSFRSFFACGDVHQRVTAWGLRDLSELKWVASDFDVHHVEIGYRQSRRLLDLARAVAVLRGGTPTPLRPPDNVDDTNVAPLLRENIAGAALGQWLTDRIREVERSLGSVPSIAIFVDNDEQIDPLVSVLQPLLSDHNLEVVGCKEGRVVGAESQIRVFDIQYMKGLEFEAVFFVGVDRLVARFGELFDKFLFVGITRAATYLGLSCEKTLPEELEGLRHHFVGGGWT